MAPATQQATFFPNVVNMINAYLAPQLGCRVVTKVPVERPDRFIRTLRTGGYRKDVVTDVARVTFECWNVSSTDAAHDAETIRDIMFWSQGKSLDEGGYRHTIYRIEEIAGPADNPDPDSTTSRYTLTLEIHVRGRKLRSIT